VQIQQQDVGLELGNSMLRLHVAKPAQRGLFPGVLFFSDIYQLGEPILRLVHRLAGYGYVVAAPEIFHRLEPPSTVLTPGGIGRLRGNHDARHTAVDDFDRDAKAVIHWLMNQPEVQRQKLASMGFCIGGHLAFRAAFDERIRASVCCYPTGLHDGVLGDEPTDTLQHCRSITGAVLAIFGSRDPHVPHHAREQILTALGTSGLRYHHLMFDADHTFMRDDGPRWDPQASDEAWAASIGFLDAQLSGKSSSASSSASTS
jgi:carboxymethylenebutenolidase